MALAAYRSVLAQPRAKAVLLLGFLARFPFSATGLLLTLHCVLTLNGTFTQAGLLVTASTLGAAISSPWRGRMLDRQGLRRTLIPPIIVNAIAWTIAPHLSFAWLVPLVFLSGLFSIPVFSIVRTSLSVIVPATMRRSAYALDSVFTEFVFMTGPALATIAVYSFGSRPAMMVLAVLIVVAGLGLMWVNPPLRSDQIVLPTKLPRGLEAAEAAASRQGGQLIERQAFEDTQTGGIPIIREGLAIDAPAGTGSATSPAASGSVTEAAARAKHAAKSSARAHLLTWSGLSVLVTTAVGAMLLVATDVGIVAVLRELGHETLVGLVITVWCAGSAVGGLAYGAMKRDVGPLWVLLLMGLLTIPLALAHSVPMILVFAFLAGLTVAPILAATGEAISHLVPEEARGEAMGWHGSAITIGAAAGGPIFGAVIDAAGANWGFGAAGIAGASVAALGLIATQIRRRRVRRRLAETVPGLR